MRSIALLLFSPVFILILLYQESTNTMRKLYFLFVVIALSLSACSSGDDSSSSGTHPSNTVNTGNSNTGGNTSNENAGFTDDTKHDNSNPITSFPEYGRLEVPALHGNTSRVLIHKVASYGINYMTEWDDVQKGPRWSAYILTSSLMRNHVPRYTADRSRGEMQYPFDPLIPSSLQWDYDWFTNDNGSYDHGHLCPSADRRCDSESQYQTFYMSNMTPMFGPFNSGVWANIEKAVRTAASRYCDTLYVVKGGTIDNGTYNGYNLVYHKLENGLVIPRYFYTAMFYRTRGKYYAIALWIDQFAYRNSNEGNLAQFAISIDQLEKRTGVDFFCNVPNADEAKMETQCDPMAWGLR